MSNVSFLANQTLPVEVGSISVGPDGKPQRREKTPLRFTFEFAGSQFRAEVEPIPGGARLSLVSDLIALPFSAESRERRRDVQAILAASRSGLPHGRLALDPRGRVHIVSSLEIATPVSPVALLAATTRILLAGTPWIDLLRRYAAGSPPPVRRTPGPARRIGRMLTGSAG